MEQGQEHLWGSLAGTLAYLGSSLPVRDRVSKERYPITHMEANIHENKDTNT